MLSDDSYEKYNYEFKITASGYDIITEIYVYNVDAKGNIVDKLNSKNTTRLKNYKLNSEAIKEIDASSIISPNPDLDIKPVGKKTIILYKQ